MVGLVAGAPMPRDARNVLWLRRSRTNTSLVLSPSARERLEAFDWKATQWGALRMLPSSAGLDEGPLPSAPLEDTLARTSEPEGRAGFESVTPAMPCGRPHTKTSSAPLRSLPTRFEANESKATKRALRSSPEIVAWPEVPLAPSP